MIFGFHCLSPSLLKPPGNRPNPHAGKSLLVSRKLERA